MKPAQGTQGHLSLVWTWEWEIDSWRRRTQECFILNLDVTREAERPHCQGQGPVTSKWYVWGKELGGHRRNGRFKVK